MGGWTVWRRFCSLLEAALGRFITGLSRNPQRGLSISLRNQECISMLKRCGISVLWLFVVVEQSQAKYPNKNKLPCTNSVIFELVSISNSNARLTGTRIPCFYITDALTTVPATKNILALIFKRSQRWRGWAHCISRNEDITLFKFREVSEAWKEHIESSCSFGGLTR